MTQKEALDILKLGRNVYLTGPAGSGKTFLLNEYINFLKARGVAVGITASTGIAATHMNGMTIHSWSGIGIRDRLADIELHALTARKYLAKRFAKTKVLVIDEVSMLHAHQLDLVDRVCRFFKQRPAPFGGMQIILAGDFFQLPPINSKTRMGATPASETSLSAAPQSLNMPTSQVGIDDNQKTDRWHFVTESDVWQNMNLRVCYLDEQYRHTDDRLTKILNEIRSNQASGNTLGKLQERLGRDVTGHANPTKLYVHNIDVDAINNAELAKINRPSEIYEMRSRGAPPLVEILKKSCLAPENLILKKDAAVMFIKNNLEDGYVNGTLGRVVDFDMRGYPIIKTEKRKIVAEPAQWTIEEEGRIKAKIEQIPLRLAWAITVHKSQGMSLDAAEIDLGKTFVEGMGYVALSRVRSLDGIKLVGINDLALRINPEALELDEGLREAACLALAELQVLEPQDLVARQKKFLFSILPENKNGKPSHEASTRDQTFELLSSGMTIAEIAKVRDLTENTIIGHLEKLVSRISRLNLEMLLKNIDFPRDRLEKIKTAFVRSGGQALSPVKAMLGDSFSYEELRLARLIINCAR